MKNEKSPALLTPRFSPRLLHWDFVIPMRNLVTSEVHLVPALCVETSQFYRSGVWKGSFRCFRFFRGYPWGSVVRFLVFPVFSVFPW